MRENKLIYSLDAPPWSASSKSKRKLIHNRCPYPQKVKNRIAYIDYDYISTLSIDDQKFLRKFTEEYYGGSFKNKNIHSKKYKKDCYDRNNRMNRCIHSRYQLFGLIYFTHLNELEIFREVYDIQIYDIVFPEPTKNGKFVTFNKKHPRDIDYIELLVKKGLV